MLRAQGGDRRSGRIETYADEILELIAARADIALAEIAAHLEHNHGALLKKAAARTINELQDAIATAIPLITPKDSRGYFAEAGYGSV